MGIRIKWLRLRKAAESVLAENGLLGKKVTINATTGLDEEFRSLVEWNKKRTGIQIYLNLLHNKNIGDIIQTLAHELAHVVLNVGSEVGQEADTAQAFDEARARLEVRLKELYEEIHHD